MIKMIGLWTTWILDYSGGGRTVLLYFAYGIYTFLDGAYTFLCVVYALSMIWIVKYKNTLLAPLERSRIQVVQNPMILTTASPGNNAVLYFSVRVHTFLYILYTFQYS